MMQIKRALLQIARDSYQLQFEEFALAYPPAPTYVSFSEIFSCHFLTKVVEEEEEEEERKATYVDS